MKALDLFCGLGGWSDGLAAEGFDVLGVEIETEIAEMYKHKVIISDVCDIDPSDYMGYELIVGSPPCRDFSRIGLMVGHNWKRPPDPEGQGLKLVNAFLNFVEVAQPRYWLMENVPRLRNYLDLPSRGTVFLGESMRRSFWGNYPAFFVPRDYNKGKFTKRRYLPDGRNGPTAINRGKYASWERAKIPFTVSSALGKAVKASINSKSFRTPKP